MGKQIKKQRANTSRPRSQHKDKQQGQHQQHSQNKQQQEAHDHRTDKKAMLGMPPSQQLTFVKDTLQKILSQPEEQIKQVDSLFILTKSPNVKVSITALRALAEVFVGTAPLEAVDLKQISQRREVKITKDEFKVIRFEELLVNQYQRYLNNIKDINLKLTATDFQGDEQLYRQFKKCLLQCLLKCLGTLWHFNHFKLLSELLVKFIIYEEAQNSIEKFLADKNISTFKAKAKLLSDIAGLFKQKTEKVLPDRLVKIINSTYIDARYLAKDVEALKFQKKKMSKRLYRQQAAEKKKEGELRREMKGDKGEKGQKGTLEMKAKIKKDKVKQKLKVKEEVEKEFAEGQAILKKKEVVRANSALLQELYYIYFKILTEQPNSKFLADVLEGVLTHAHLINIDLTHALIAHLDTAHHFHRAIWQKNRNNHTLESRLRLVFTAESLLNGPLSVYNMDDLKTTTAFYQVLRDINDSGCFINSEHFRMLAITFEETLLRRRQLNQEVCASLLREMARLLPKKQIPKLYLLELIRAIISKYSRLSRMLEQDNEGFGLYGFNPHTMDPQATNAINTEILTIIKPLSNIKASTYYNQKVIQLSKRLCRLTFTRMEEFPNMEDLLRDDLTVFS